MTNLLVLGVTDGRAVSGTGNVSTIDALRADGGQVTLGTTTDAAVITSANGTVQQYLRGLVQLHTSKIYSTSNSVTRPADTETYAAKDVVGTSNSVANSAVLTFANVGPSGKSVKLIGHSLEIDAAAVIASETSYRLALFNSGVVPSALKDNDAWTFATTDRATFLGYVELGTPVDEGSTLYIETNNVNKPILLATSNVYGYLITSAGYVATSARVYKVTLHFETE